MRKSTLRTIVGVIAAGALALPGIAVAGAQAKPDNRRRAAKFEQAQRIDMESFRDFDAEAFRDIHDRDAVSVFPSGQRFAGIDAIMAAQRNHFADREAVWSWTEIDRRVFGCDTAYIEYEATYEIPRIGFSQTALTVVTYVYKHGRWRAVYDQDTLLPPPA